MGFNYGSEPMVEPRGQGVPGLPRRGDLALVVAVRRPGAHQARQRPRPLAAPRHRATAQEKEDCGLPESCFVSNVFHTYTGDATKIRFGLAGVKETHVFHLHAHQWLADPRGDAVTGEGPGAKPESTTIDSQSFGPGEAYTAELLYGAGSKNGTFGDSIFHCHLYPHFAEGFWSHHARPRRPAGRHDRHAGRRQRAPARSRCRAGRPRPRRPRTTPATPGMIPGTYGWRAPQPPGSITEGGADGTPVRPAPRLVARHGPSTPPSSPSRTRSSSATTAAATPRPGAPFADPCPTGAREVDYDVTVLQRDLVYNEAGHHDPQARFMVLTKDVHGDPGRHARRSSRCSSGSTPATASTSR